MLKTRIEVSHLLNSERTTTTTLLVQLEHLTHLLELTRTTHNSSRLPSLRTKHRSTELVSLTRIKLTVMLETKMLVVQVPIMPVETLGLIVKQLIETLRTRARTRIKIQVQDLEISNNNNLQEVKTTKPKKT